MASRTDIRDGPLNEFAAVTGISLEDSEVVEKAQLLLSRHNHNLNNAVLDFFENGLDSPEPLLVTPIEAISTPEFASTGVERHQTSPIHRNLQHEFQYHSLLPRLPKAPRITNNWQFELGIHASMKDQNEKTEQNTVESKNSDASPKKTPLWWLLLLIFPKAVSMIFNLIRFLLGLSTPSVMRSMSVTKFNYDDYQVGYNFERDLAPIEAATNYNIRTSGFNQVHEESKSEYEFMFMVLVDDRSSTFVDDLLLSPDFDTLFNKSTGRYNGSRLYISNVDRDPEAFEVNKHYRCRKYPFFVLLGNVSNDPAVMSSMSIIFKCNFSLRLDSSSPARNLSSLASMLAQVKQHMADYSPQLITKRHDKQEMELSRILKEQQDEAYLESLQQDIIKKQEKELKSQQDEMQARSIEAKGAFLAHLKASDFFGSRVDRDSPAEMIRVAIKMPSGKRLIQKFPKTSAVNEVYLFVETQLVETKEEITDIPSMSIEQYCQTYPFNFELIKPFPKVVLPATSNTIEQYGELKSGDNILVEFLDDE